MKRLWTLVDRRYAVSMIERVLLALAYVIPGAGVSALALQAGRVLSARYAELRIKAAKTERPVPPLVTMYFRGSARVLVMTAGIFLAVIAADAAISIAAPGAVLSLVLGYGGGVALLICAFALLMQGTADRTLQLYPRGLRLTQIVAGVVGIAAAAYGMGVVTWYGGVWAG